MLKLLIFTIFDNGKIKTLINKFCKMVKTQVLNITTHVVVDARFVIHGDYKLNDYVIDNNDVLYLVTGIIGKDVHIRNVRTGFPSYSFPTSFSKHIEKEIDWSDLQDDDDDED